MASPFPPYAALINCALLLCADKHLPHSLAVTAGVCVSRGVIVLSSLGFFWRKVLSPKRTYYSDPVYSRRAEGLAILTGLLLP